MIRGLNKQTLNFIGINEMMIKNNKLNDSENLCNTLQTEFKHSDIRKRKYKIKNNTNTNLLNRVKKTKISELNNIQSFFINQIQQTKNPQINNIKADPWSFDQCPC